MLRARMADLEQKRLGIAFLEERRIVVKWEYCFMRIPVRERDEKIVGRPTLTFFSLPEGHRDRPVEDIDREIATLGQEGWEMYGKTENSFGWGAEWPKSSDILWFKRPMPTED